MLNTELEKMESCILPFSFKIFVKEGTNAAKKVPSASIFLKKFVILNDAKNTSDINPTPEYLAIKLSLTNPKTLAIIEKKVITKADLKILINAKISSLLLNALFLFFKI